MVSIGGEHIDPVLGQNKNTIAGGATWRVGARIFVPVVGMVRGNFGKSSF